MTAPIKNHSILYESSTAPSFFIRPWFLLYPWCSDQGDSNILMSFFPTWLAVIGVYKKYAHPSCCHYRHIQFYSYLIWELKTRINALLSYGKLCLSKSINMLNASNCILPFLLKTKKRLYSTVNYINNDKINQHWHSIHLDQACESELNVGWCKSQATK